MDERKKLIIIGANKTAKHVYKFVQDYSLYDVIGFAVNKQYKLFDEYEGKPVFEIESIDGMFKKEDVYLFVAILWNNLNADRKFLYTNLKEKGFKFANIISPLASLHSNIIGDNCWIHDYVVIQNNATIGNNVMIMARSLVGSGVVIGNHCFLGTNCTVAGGCTIGDQSFIGINCTVFDDTNIGRKCILGACTAIKRNMDDCTVCKTSSTIAYEKYSDDEIELKLQYKKNIR